MSLISNLITLEQMVGPGLALINLQAMFDIIIFNFPSHFVLSSLPPCSLHLLITHLFNGDANLNMRIYVFQSPCKFRTKPAGKFTDQICSSTAVTLATPYIV